MANKEKSNTEKMKEKFADKTMDVKQLENVAGGALVESQFDNAFLNCLLGDSGCKRIDPFRCRTSQEMDRKLEAMKASIIAGWAKVGVTCEPKIDFDFVSPSVGFISPVPGGVGPMTIASLMMNASKIYP